MYCGNYTTWRGFFTEPDECGYEGSIELGDPAEDDLASWVCPDCGATNTYRDHAVTDYALPSGEKKPQ